MAFKYLRLAAELQAAISEGTFADKLPTEQTLCDAYQVSRQTVRQALEHLVELGLVENLCPVPITSLTHDTKDGRACRPASAGPDGGKARSVLFHFVEAGPESKRLIL